MVRVSRAHNRSRQLLHPGHLLPSKLGLHQDTGRPTRTEGRETQTLSPPAWAAGRGLAECSTTIIETPRERIATSFRTVLASFRVFHPRSLLLGSYGSSTAARRFVPDFGRPNTEGEGPAEIRKAFRLASALDPILGTTTRNEVPRCRTGWGFSCEPFTHAARAGAAGTATLQRQDRTDGVENERPATAKSSDKPAAAQDRMPA